MAKESEPDLLPIIREETTKTLMEKKLGLHHETGRQLQHKDGHYDSLAAIVCDFAREEFIDLADLNRDFVTQLSKFTHNVYSEGDAYTRAFQIGMSIVSAAFSIQAKNQYSQSLSTLEEKDLNVVDLILTNSKTTHVKPDLLDEALNAPRINPHLQPHLSRALNLAANSIWIEYADKIRIGGGTMYRVINGVWLPLEQQFKGKSDPEISSRISEFALRNGVSYSYNNEQSLEDTTILNKNQF
jgi:hypothetical protein